MPPSVPCCTFCSLPVLGLSGQDFLLDTGYFLDDPADRAARAAHAYGDCHLRCLIESTWGSFWATRIRARFAATALRLAAAQSRITVFRNDPFGESAAVRDDGLFLTVTDLALKERAPVEGGTLVPVRHPLSVSLADRADLVRAVAAAFAAGEPFPLAAVISAFGVRQRLVFPLALAGGTLTADPGTGPVASVAPAPRRSGRPSGEEGWITAVARYHLFLPTDMEQAITPTLVARDSRRRR